MEINDPIYQLFLVSCVWVDEAPLLGKVTARELREFCIKLSAGEKPDDLTKYLILKYTECFDPRTRLLANITAHEILSIIDVKNTICNICLENQKKLGNCDITFDDNCQCNCHFIKK